MAIDLEGRIKGRMTAPFHVQLQPDKKADPLTSPSEIVLQGQVVRVFRSDGRLGLGDRVAFKIWVCQPGDEPTGPVYVYNETFTQASHIEVYLYGLPPDCSLAAYEFAILGAPTDTPTMTVAQLQEFAPPVPSLAKEQFVPKEKWWKRILRKSVDRDS
jgi:hypothetical protein